MHIAHARGAHRSVRWRLPADAKRRPGVLTALCHGLVRGLEQPEGSLWHRIRLLVVVAGYPLSRALYRVRALRADGAESLLALVVAMVYLADVRTGFVGKPRLGGGTWYRYTLMDLAQLAYGAQGTAELRRVRRAFGMMVSLGWADPTRQVREYRAETGTFASFPGIRRINLDRLCAMTGTRWLLQRDRQHADRAKGRHLTSMRTDLRGGGVGSSDALHVSGPQVTRARIAQWVHDHGGPSPPVGLHGRPMALAEILAALAAEP